jgi:radical SAM superfamily enzyme YgiQ (UPF0313 family)
MHLLPGPAHGGKQGSPAAGQRRGRRDREYPVLWIDRINIADDLFVSDKKKVKEVCSEIQRRGLRFAWSAFARVNTVDLETLRVMKDTGCDGISFGVESGNQEMLDRIKKKITLDQVRRAVGLCQEVGLVVHTSFIVGLPGETLKTLQDSRSFGESLYKEYGVYYGFHLLSPFPGRPFGKRWQTTIWRS